MRSIWSNVLLTNQLMRPFILAECESCDSDWTELSVAANQCFTVCGAYWLCRWKCINCRTHLTDFSYGINWCANTDTQTIGRMIRHRTVKLSKQTDDANVLRWSGQILNASERKNKKKTERQLASEATTWVSCEYWWTRAPARLPNLRINRNIFMAFIFGFFCRCHHSN